MRFHHTTLDNGLEVIAELNDQAHSIAAGFFVKAGSRDESDALAGVSHFLEHMTFKGTARRDALAVNRDFDKVGAKHNAQTSEEDTFYHVTCLPEYLPRAFDVLADILRPTLREEDFETEKKVIIEEIQMYLDNPMSVAYEAAKAAHFGTHPLGNSILGTVDSITAMKADEMRAYFASRYSPANIVLGVRRQRRLGPARRAGLEPLQAVARRARRPPGRAGPRRPVVQGDPPRGRPAADGHRRQRRPAAGKRRPLRRAPAGDDPRRPHQLAALLGADRPRPRRRRRTELPGLQRGRRLLHLPELRPRRHPGQPGADRRGLSRRRRDRRHPGGTGPGQEQGARPVGPAERAPDGPAGRPLASTGSTAARTCSIEQELDAFSKVSLDQIRRLLHDWPLWPMTIVSVGPTTKIKPPQ